MRRACLSLLMLISLLPAGFARAEVTRYADDGDRASLLEAVDRTQAYLTKLSAPSLTLAGKPVPLERLRKSLTRFRELVEDAWGTPEFAEDLDREFEAVPMAETQQADPVHFTGYHLPLLEARTQPDRTFKFPLYAPPRDVVRVELGKFRPDLAGSTLLGRMQGDELLPYYSRSEIEDGRALANRGLELAWVSDELALYGLMVQGSGLLRFADGRVVNVNYAGQNGQPYRSLGKALVADGKIPQALVSMPAITSYFKQHPDQLHGYLLRNPSYVFFEVKPDGPYGVSGIQLTAGRAIATDKSLYPAGLLAWIKYPRASFDAQGNPTRWEPSGRFVVDADTGGAIRGPNRVDIYWGGGDEAAWRAGTLNGYGELSYLLLKPQPDPQPSPSTTR